MNCEYLKKVPFLVVKCRQFEVGNLGISTSLLDHIDPHLPIDVDEFMVPIECEKII